MKEKKTSLLLRAVIYLLIFTLLFTLCTFLFLPKRISDTGANAQIAGFYKEPKNTIDVIGLGSCNLYSSLSPVVLYEKTGITCYNMCCPDEEFSASYYFLKDALKTQTPKAVVVEALFFLAPNTNKREYYNRLAVDYVPMSADKIRFMLDVTDMEVDVMKEYDPTTPDKLLTFAGYAFPLLRYHSRNDFGKRDLAYLFRPGQYSFLKGGFPQYDYTRNDGNEFSTVFNGDTITDVALKYIPMIKELCDERGIPMIVVKSPNYLRWGRDGVRTGIVRDYCAQLGVPFVDFHASEYNDFEIWDYGDQTGRLNVYGMRKFSETLGDYLQEELGLTPTSLSDTDRAAWESCVEKYYAKSLRNDCDIYQGHLAQLSCLDGAMQVRWNVCDDCSSYSVYRCDGKDGAFRLLTDSASGETYADTEVTGGCGYTYYVVPNEGKLKGTASPTMYAVYLDMPGGFTAENENGAIRVSWDPVPGAQKYVLQRRMGLFFTVEDLVTVEGTEYLDETASPGKLYYYRLMAVTEQDGKTYSSVPQLARALSRSVPEIREIRADGQITVRWTPVEGADELRLFRRAENEEDFVQVAVLNSEQTEYVDPSAVKGVEFFYKLAVYDEELDYTVTSDDSNTVGAKIVG